ncbi:hypothetical protein HF086_009002 [Spodoptera exigua]|uniref:MULE transposase domain-containing protein n=1 Tax=Spodoptera exigua TaxID=7107 RepID=A0A922M3H5_SPOEX|nr:hypothetical protein HF086_009002 [Spodoptera exigua]
MPVDKTSDETISDLRKQRGSLKGRITQFKKFVDSFQGATLTPLQVEEFKVRIQAASDLFSKFNAIETELESFLSDAEFQTNSEYVNSLESIYFTAIAGANCLIHSVETSSRIPDDSACRKPNVKLPEIKLPIFDGSCDNWLEFKHSYSTMIHKRSDLDEIQKFHYLRSALTGSALQVISALEFSPANYIHAWELLENRFHNERLLVNNHVKALFNSATLKSESSTQIRKLIDTILRNLRALNPLDEPTEKWDTLIIYLIVTKLDVSTEREWEKHKGAMSLGVKDKVKLDDLLSFLRNRADMLDMITANHSKPKEVSQITTSDKKSDNKYHNRSLNRIHSYVSSKDDLITGDDDHHQLLSICQRTSEVLQSGCFPLRKWTFNSDTYQSESVDHFIGEHSQTKTLGLGWHNTDDDLYFATNIDNNYSKLTKRVMLSILSQIYDPLGLLSPVVIIPKLLLQKLWLSKIDWDTPVPMDIVKIWHNFVETLKYLKDIRIIRHVRGAYAQYTELHIFSDASQDAYGACAYIRTYSDNSDVTVRLLCAKSKVAPLKSISIPRLELCGALIGAKLYKKIVESLRLEFSKVYFWTDSTIVMGWLKMSPHLLKTFVQNRVSEVNELTGDSVWLHVGSKDNPADLLSRGYSLDLLKDCELWWNGPPYLRNLDDFDNRSDITDVQNLPELKGKQTCLLTTEYEDLIDFERYGSFSKLKRVGAYILRFIDNTRIKKIDKDNRRTGSLSVSECNAAQKMLIRQLYSIHAHNEKSKSVTPIIFSLLPDKSQETYAILLRLIKSVFPVWKPLKVTMDYEKAAMNAVAKVYNGIEIKGCYFHYNRCLFRKAKQFKISTPFKKRHVSRCAGIARLPAELTASGIEYVMRKSPPGTEIEKFNAYFKTQWLEKTNFNKTCCCNKEQLRTTNNLEGWHSRINRYIGKKNTTIANLLDTLIKETKITNIFKTNSKKAKIYLEIDHEIDSAVSDLKSGLITVGHCVELISPYAFKF